MTLICNEGHSEHDELSCVRTFFRGKYPSPKRTEHAEGTYPYRSNTTRSSNGAHRAKKARK